MSDANPDRVISVLKESIDRLKSENSQLEHAQMEKESGGSCPFNHMWKKDKTLPPSDLNLKVLQPTKYLNKYTYADQFNKLDLAALKKDMEKVLTTSQDWWPADYGHYGPLMIRLAWHSAGTYRTHDGRGGGNTGNMRFAPLNSWPDNGNLDKARRLLLPLKQKYGKKISWGDLIILSGNVALESMGFKTFGFGGGRVDVWAPEEDTYWGPETVVMKSERYLQQGVYSKDARQSLQKPLAAVQMGLIYVNPEGPDQNPDPLLAAHDIRETFARMAMNDEETVALIAGGHTFGKGHGAAPPDGVVGDAPNDATIEQQGLGWKNDFGSGKGAHTITSGLEGAWTYDPTSWNHEFFEILFKYEWELKKGPGGGHQWYPKCVECHDMVRDAHIKDKKHPPMMYTTDLALRFDPSYGEISKRFLENHELFADTFAKAWYKLTHRDMGPATRCLGPEVPPPQLWQDPVPNPTAEQLGITEAEIASLKATILSNSTLTGSQLVDTAWGSASTFRVSDFRGGANGGRINLAPQKDWPVNNQFGLQETLAALSAIKTDFDAKGAAKISLADLIVLGGCAAIEQAAKAGGREVSVRFTPGRTDALAEQTDVESMGVLEPLSDGFRNFGHPSAHALVDRAQLLTLSAPEMAVLVAGFRVLNVSSGTANGVFTKTPGTLTNDFFVNLVDMSTKWESTGKGTFEGKDSASGATKWTATAVDLIFGSNPELRAIAEYYAESDSQEEFVDDFAAAFAKVMNLHADNHFI